MAADFDRNESISDDVVRELAKAGLLGSFLPTEHGGRSFDLISYGLLHQEIGAACSSDAFVRVPADRPYLFKTAGDAE